MALQGEAQQLTGRVTRRLGGNSCEYRDAGKEGLGMGKLWAHLLICGPGTCRWSRGGCPLMGSLKVAGVILGWPSTCLWGPVVAVVDEQGPPREYRNFMDTLAVGEMLGPLQWIKWRVAAGWAIVFLCSEGA